eukprot:3401189-Amphidinium_carterae.1
MEASMQRCSRSETVLTRLGPQTSSILTRKKIKSGTFDCTQHEGATDYVRLSGTALSILSSMPSRPNVSVLPLLLSEAEHNSQNSCT